MSESHSFKNVVGLGFEVSIGDYIRFGKIVYFV